MNTHTCCSWGERYTRDVMPMPYLSQDVEAAAAAAEEAVPEAFDEHLPAGMPPQGDHQQPPQPQPRVAATSGNSSGDDAQPERFAMRGACKPCAVRACGIISRAAALL